MWAFDSMRCLLGGSDFFFAHFEIILFADFELFLLFGRGVAANKLRGFAADRVNETAEKI